jgi:hypothetical protein
VKVERNISSLDVCTDGILACVSCEKRKEYNTVAVIFLGNVFIVQCSEREITDYI